MQFNIPSVADKNC